MARAEPAPDTCRLLPCGPGRYALSGEVGFATAGRLLDEGLVAFAGQASIEVDLAGMSSADSVGLALLIEWTRRARSDGRQISFRAVPARLIDIARISGVDDLLPIVG
jgi:phospholipid transport system transporter-binding protein